MLNSSLFLSFDVGCTSIRFLCRCVIQSSRNKDSRKVGLGSSERIIWNELLSILVSSSAVRIRWSSSVTTTLSGNYTIEKQIRKGRGKSSSKLMISRHNGTLKPPKINFVYRTYFMVTYEMCHEIIINNYNN